MLIKFISHLLECVKNTNNIICLELQIMKLLCEHT